MTVQKSIKHLIKKPANWNVEIKNTMLQQAAYLAEFNLQAAGAVPEKDYNIMDCFNLGAFVYLGSKLDDMSNKINSIIAQTPDTDEDDDDCVEDSKDISDSGDAKPMSKVGFIIGYQ